MSRLGAWARDRNATVPFAPTGQRIPAQGANPGNCIRENRCVLKEHRIGKAGSMSEAPGYAAFLQNAGFFSGLIPRVCTLGWYAMPIQGMGFETAFCAVVLN